MMTQLAPNANWPAFEFIPQSHRCANTPETIDRHKRGLPHPVKTYLSGHPGALAREIVEATGLAMSTVSATLHGYCKSHKVRSDIGGEKNSRGQKLKRYYLLETLQ